MAPGEEIRIRTAGLGDLPHLIHHRRSMFREMGHTEAAVLDEVERVSERYFRDAVPRGAYRAWVAESSGRGIVAGGGVAVNDWPGHPGEKQARRVWILNVYTEPEFRRRGIARVLMETMVEWCRAEGFTAVSLHASMEGRALYESIGFAPTNEMRLMLR